MKKAWYLDDGILLEGRVQGKEFYPDTDECGFDVQAFDNDMLDTEIFFDLSKALSICGNIPVVGRSERDP